MANRLGQFLGRRWKWVLFVTASAGLLCLRNLVLLIAAGFLAWQNPKLQMWVMLKFLHHQLRQPLPDPPKPSLPAAAAAALATRAQSLRSAADLFRATNVWDVHLRFTTNQWTKLGPDLIPPVAGFIQPDGSAILRNPAALRNGLAGVVGINEPWSEADLDFGDAHFRQVGARFKGNGTFLGVVSSFKRPFKFDLDKHQSAQQVAGRTTLNFHNLIADLTWLSDTLGYEFFRDAGVPASRTAFARLRITLAGRFEGRLLGLYVLVENPDADWARERFGVDGVALFKPVTYDLFADLGDAWGAYKPIYDPKTQTTPAQRRRLMDLAKLVTHACDADFAAQIGQFIDLEEFARFLACEAMLSNYDGILSNGQNFLLYLDPRTERFGFIPWDLDHCWGEFPMIGTIEQREQASLWHPWVGTNHFLARTIQVPAFRERYRSELQRLRTTLFVPERLSRRVDDLAVVVRPFIREESTSRLEKFEFSVADQRAKDERPREGDSKNPGPPGFALKRFFVKRAAAVDDQLAGRSDGVVPPRTMRK